ncbi:MAG TPA: HAMP domain-containing sensor histidine kinase [Vicinamibacterales bacterium]|jgi:signal transduction histidine kinase|nr:HAMP domain-containing sensor histidine kinase [Vicinamibacterales bacterium]
MSSAPEDAGRPGRPLFGDTFGLRIALWYSTLFVLGAIAIVSLTYYLTSVSLAQRDQQIIRAKLGDYAAAYARGGVRVLAATVRAEQAAAPERLFVRVVDRGVEALVLSNPDGWDASKLETVSARLDDGTLVQVGKSTEARDDLLRQFRAALGLVTLLIVVIALSGGWLATQSAIYPIRRLTQAVSEIIRTGRTDARVPLGHADRGDAIDELTVLFNAMLDKIEGLVTAMRGALDNVSHDLRTPLTRLRGTAEMALADPPDLDRYREALADAVEESDRVLLMLNTLMDISEAESGTLQLRRQPVRLADIASRAVDLYKDVADAKGVALTTAVDDQASGSEASAADAVVVSGDPPRLEQVAANLIDNAVKYTPAGGRVEVRIARPTEGVNGATLRVSDTGPGIPPDELPRIWDRLFRGDTSRAERGLGLGLSLVKAIVEAHGGTVNVTSEVGKGSTFTVLLPVS